MSDFVPLDPFQKPHVGPSSPDRPSNIAQQSSVSSASPTTRTQHAANSIKPAGLSNPIPVPPQGKKKLKEATTEGNTVREVEQQKTGITTRIGASVRTWLSNRKSNHGPRFSLINYLRSKLSSNKQESIQRASPDLPTSNIKFQSQERFIQFTTAYSASSSGTTYLKPDSDPNISDDLDAANPTYNLDASLTTLIKNNAGEITGGIVASADGFERGGTPERDEAIASIAKQGCRLLTKALMQENDPDKLTRILTPAIHKIDLDLKSWNKKHGEGDAATNLAAMRLFKDENGKGRVIGMTVGNQRLIAINARTGVVEQLNNKLGEDDCSSKSFIGGRLKGYENHEIKTFDISLDYPAEEVILVALTDGAWQNFEKGADPDGSPNPYLIDCTKLQTVISARNFDVPLDSQTVMKRLTQHVSERSLSLRKQIFHLNEERVATGMKLKELQNKLKVEHQNQFNDVPISKEAKATITEYNIAKDTLETRKRLNRPPEMIAEAETQLNTQEEKFKELSILTRIQFFSQKTAPPEEEEGLQGMTALEEEISQKHPLTDEQKGYLLYIQQYRAQLRQYLSLQKKEVQLKEEIEQISKGLDDVTITASSPFGEPNPLA